jgi:hypothetical protein
MNSPFSPKRCNWCFSRNHPETSFDACTQCGHLLDGNELNCTCQNCREFRERIDRARERATARKGLGRWDAAPDLKPLNSPK